jgi:hypothetical protein
MNKMNSIEWKQIVSTQKGITKDKALRAKLFLKISAPCGHAFSDLDHYNKVDARLEGALNRLAKRHQYVTNGFTCYQAWTDKS